MNHSPPAPSIPALPSLLEPSETSDELRSEEQHPHPSIHRQHQSSRQRIIAMLASSTDDALAKRAQKLHDCCRYPTIRIDAEGELFFSPSRCRDRLCPLCASVHARRMAERVRATVDRWSECRHLTLTLKSTDEPLVTQLDRLVHSFRRLRQRRWWRSHVRGGIGTVEITFNASTQQWHPHLHVLLDGSYVPQHQLADQWRSVTDDSFIVHITAVHSREDATRYIAKYVTKPGDVASLDRSRAEELASALVGRRTLIAFGAAHGVRLPVRERGTDHAGSRHVVGLNVLQKCLDHSQVFAQWAVHRLHTELPRVARLIDPAGVYRDRGPPTIELVRTSSLRQLLDDCAEWCSTLQLPARYTQPRKPRDPDPTLF